MLPIATPVKSQHVIGATSKFRYTAAKMLVVFESICCWLFIDDDASESGQTIVVMYVVSVPTKEINSTVALAGSDMY